MFDALQIAATGMHAQQRHVETIANNLANANTMGFKRSRVSFVDLVSLAVAPSGAAENIRAVTDAPSHGNGVAVAAVHSIFDGGEPKQTESAFDVTIAGDGFFEILMPDGTSAYSRGGSLKVNVDGQLALESGQPLKPGLTIPHDVQELTIDSSGRVMARSGRQRTALEVGQLELVRFVGPTALAPLGDGLYRATEASGEPVAGRAGRDGLGTVRQGYLETSNVKMVEEVVNLMVAQRAYEASVKVAQASDEMLSMVNNLRRGS